MVWSSHIHVSDSLLLKHRLFDGFVPGESQCQGPAAPGVKNRGRDQRRDLPGHIYAAPSLKEKMRRSPNKIQGDVLSE